MKKYKSYLKNSIFSLFTISSKQIYFSQYLLFLNLLKYYDFKLFFVNVLKLKNEKFVKFNKFIKLIKFLSKRKYFFYKRYSYIYKSILHNVFFVRLAIREIDDRAIYDLIDRIMFLGRLVIIYNQEFFLSIWV